MNVSLFSWRPHFCGFRWQGQSHDGGWLFLIRQTALSDVRSRVPGAVLRASCSPNFSGVPVVSSRPCIAFETTVRLPDCSEAFHGHLTRDAGQAEVIVGDILSCRRSRDSIQKAKDKETMRFMSLSERKKFPSMTLGRYWSWIVA